MLSLERYAIIRASIEASGDRDGALAKADVLPREWLLIERRWHRQLAAEAARGRTDLAARYLAAFNGVAGRDAAAAAAPPAAAAAAAPMQQLRVAPQPALSAPSPQRAASPPRAMPSYLATPALAAPPPVVQPAAMPSTGEIDNRRLQRAPMPFAPGAAAVDPSSKQPAPPAFVAGEATAPREAAPAQAARPSAQTAYLDASQLARAPTPFVAGPAAAAGPSPPPSAPPLNSAGTGTALVDEAQVDLPAPTMPTELPTLSVDQYAWVTASLKRAKAGELEATLTRLRLTQASRVSLDAIWKAHMARYPAVKQAFILALAKHLSPP